MQFRDDMTTPDMIALYTNSILFVLAILETISFAVFVYRVESMNPNREGSVWKNMTKSFNVQIFLMFFWLAVDVGAICYSLALSHDTTEIKVLIAFRNFALSTIEACYLFYTWGRTGTILELQNKTLYNFTSILVKISPFLFYGQFVVSIIAICWTSSTIPNTINKIWVIAVGFATSCLMSSLSTPLQKCC